MYHPLIAGLLAITPCAQKPVEEENRSARLSADDKMESLLRITYVLELNLHLYVAVMFKPVQAHTPGTLENMAIALKLVVVGLKLAK